MCNAVKMVSDRLWRTRKGWSGIKQFCLFIGMVMLLLPFSGEARAAEKLQLIGAKNLSGKSLLAGVEMTMEPGWHTYWRHPGDSGIAPTFDWSKSRNVADLKLLWPAPLRFDAPDDLTVGYTDHVIWPVLIRPIDPTKSVTLDLSMHYGICSDICVPGEARLRLTLPDGATEKGAHLIRQYLARVPTPPRDGMEVTAHVEKEQLFVSISGVVDDAPALIVEGPRSFWFGKPVARQDGKAIRYVVPFERTGDRPLKGADIGLIFSGPRTAIEVTQKVE